MHVGRTLADVVHQPARRHHARFEAAEALEDFHALLVFQRLQLLADQAHLVEPEAGGRIQRIPADGDVLVVADRRVAVAQRGIAARQFAQRARLAVVDLVAGDHRDRGRGVLQRRVAEAAEGIHLRIVGMVAALTVGLDVDGRQRRGLRLGGGVLAGMGKRHDRHEGKDQRGAGEGNTK